MWEYVENRENRELWGVLKFLVAVKVFGIYSTILCLIWTSLIVPG